MNRNDAALLQKVAKAEGFPTENIDAYVVMLQGKPFITSAGLHHKLKQRFGEAWYVRAEIASAEEHDLIRDSTGIEHIVVCRGVVEVKVDGETHTYEDFGTAHAGNMKGFVTMATYPLEMASRRATNRAMRLAVQTGMTSVDEMDARQDMSQNTAQRTPGAQGTRTQHNRPGTHPEKDRASKTAIDGYKHAVLSAHKAGVLDADEYAAAKSVADNPRGVLKATLDKAQARLQERVDEFEAAQEGGE